MATESDRRNISVSQIELKSCFIKQQTFKTNKFSTVHKQRFESNFASMKSPGLVDREQEMTNHSAVLKTKM